MEEPRVIERFMRTSPESLSSEITFDPSRCASWLRLYHKPPKIAREGVVLLDLELSRGVKFNVGPFTRIVGLSTYFSNVQMRCGSEHG